MKGQTIKHNILTNQINLLLFIYGKQKTNKNYGARHDNSLHSSSKLPREMITRINFIFSSLYPQLGQFIPSFFFFLALLFFEPSVCLFILFPVKFLQSVFLYVSVQLFFSPPSPRLWLCGKGVSDK